MRHRAVKRQPSHRRGDNGAEGASRTLTAVAPRSRLVGRAEEQARIGDLLTRAPLVTVMGPGGVGKTRLAHEVAPTATVVELADLPIGADLDAVCGQVGYETPEAAAVALGERGALVVLDGCEHVLEAARAFLVRFLAGTTAPRVLATSRTPLRVDGEHVVVLEPLEADDAAALFLDRADAAGASWVRTPETLAAVDALCRRLDGLPLAIELAAARSRAIAPATLLQHLDDRLNVLHGVGAAVDVSVALLDDEERRAFRTLGVFAGAFDVELARAVIGTADRLHVVDLLSHLVDRSLVVAAHHGPATRYRLLELLRDHAVALLVDAGEWEAAHDRFVDAMAAEADRIVADGVAGWSGDLLARVDTHLRNLFAAIDWCVEHDASPVRAHRLVLPLFVACHQSRSIEVLAAGERVLRRWPAGGAGRAEVLAVLATAAVVSGNVARAGQLGGEATADPDATAIAHLVAERALGFAARGAGDLESAGVHLGRGRAAATSLGARSFGRELAGFEASVLDLQGRTDDALALVAGALDDALADGDTLTEAWLRLVATAAHVRAGRWDDARAQLTAAHAAARSGSYPWWAGAILRMQAAVAERWDPARWLEALESGVAAGSVGEVALTLRAAAATAAHHGLADLADELLDAAPWSRELTVLPELYPDAVRRLTERRPLRPPPPDLLAAVATGRRLLAGTPSATPTEASAPSLRRDGEAWTATYDGRTVVLRDRKGIADLARLLTAPGTEVHCLELIGGSDLGGPGPALDERARREYERRIRDLQADIDEARSANDPHRAERAEAELDALVEQLSEAFGLGGRVRTTGSAAERARSTVTARIRAAIRGVAEVHPELGRHLDNAVRTGTWCAYRPESESAWSVTP